MFFILFFLLDCLKTPQTNWSDAFQYFSNLFSLTWASLYYLHRTSIMALNISLHLLLSPLIYILLLPPSSPPRAWLSSSPVFTPLYGSIIQPILSKELSRSGSVFFWELPSLTVIADVFLLLLHLQQQGDIYNTCYHSILLDTFYSRLSNFKTDSAHSPALFFFFFKSE